jgi:hypothetical protein
MTDYKLMSRELTEEMIRAAKDAAFFYPSDFARIFRAMWDAAPDTEKE